MTKVLFSGTKSRPPIIATGSLSIVEGNTDIQIVATQPHGGGKLTYGITGGADAALFDIVNTGLMYFLVAPVFASPTDANTDNVYEVEVTVTGRGGLTDTQLILITVLAAGGGGDTVGTPIGLLFLLTHTISAGAYTAPAVHFDGFTHLDIASLSTTENGFLSFALWIKYGSGPSPLWMSYVHDVDDTIWNIVRIDDGGILYAEVDNPADGFFAVNSGDPPSINLQDGAWHSVIGTLRANLAEGLKVAKLYVDRTDVTSIVSDSGAAFDIFTNGTSHRFFAHISPHFTGDAADCRWMFGTSLLTGSDIASSTLDLFATADNKPVDPAVATAALGTAGTVLFSGDHTAFATNQGTGGSFTLTGTLTDASTSPSD